MIETGDSSTPSIDIKYVLGNDTNIENELQIDKKNDNSEIDDNNLDSCNLDNNELSKME